MNVACNGGCIASSVQHRAIGLKRNFVFDFHISNLLKSLI